MTSIHTATVHASKNLAVWASICSHLCTQAFLLLQRKMCAPLIVTFIKSTLIKACLLVAVIYIKVDAFDVHGRVTLWLWCWWGAMD